MRFSIFVAGAMAAIATAQTTADVPTNVPTTVASPTFSLSPEQSSQLACVEACSPGDVDCQSHCVPVPSPNDAQANATVECAAKCNQGDGSEADTLAYGECVQGCIKTHYYEENKGTPNQTGGSGSGSGSGSSGTKTGSSSSATGSSSSDSNDDSSDGDDDDSSDATGTGSSSGTSTGSSASATSTNAAAVPVAVSGASLVGLIAAVLAL